MPAALFLTLTLAGCARATPEQQFINDAAAAMGGRDRIDAVKTLTIEGEGVNFNLGQDLKPEAATQTFAITGYKRELDLANSRQRVQQTRTPQFAFFQGPQPQTQIQGLDGAVAFNVNPGTATRLGGLAAVDRAADLYHHPLTLLRSTADPKTTIANVRTMGAVRQAEIHTAAGPVLTMTIDAAGVPLSISSNAYHANLGDVVMTTTMSDYADVNGLKLPRRLAGKVDDFTTWEIQASSQTVDGDTADLAAPATVSAPRTDKPEGLSPPVAVTVAAVGKGVWLLAGQSHHSALIEFSDHLMLIDAPQSEARTMAVIAKARDTVPGKPLTQLVTTHHHFDHTAGLRAAIAEGLTVITHAGNREWVEHMAKRPHTRQPDALAKNPRPVTVETVDGEREFKDAAMAVTLYHVAGNPHSDTMLMAYVPGVRVVIQVDAFGPGSQSHPYAANLLENIRSRKLAVDRIVPLHSVIAPFAELVKVGS
ncbi:MAG: MBL fold metallo-hydrolase [Acidobacteriota bacterium]|nr:MBL fold metallo-hydrolase [Acidobacteriota bacterium]